MTTVLMPQMARLENLWVILGSLRCWLSEFQEPVEASAGGIKGALLRFGGVVDEGATVIVDGAREHLPHGLLTSRRVHIQCADKLAAQKPQVIPMVACGLARHTQVEQMEQERGEAHDEMLSRLEITGVTGPAVWPVVQIGTVLRQALGVGGDNRSLVPASC